MIRNEVSERERYYWSCFGDDHPWPLLCSSNRSIGTSYKIKNSENESLGIYRDPPVNRLLLRMEHTDGSNEQVVACAAQICAYGAQATPSSLLV